MPIRGRTPRNLHRRLRRRRMRSVRRPLADWTRDPARDLFPRHRVLREGRRLFLNGADVWFAGCEAGGAAGVDLEGWGRGLVGGCGLGHWGVGVGGVGGGWLGAFAAADEDDDEEGEEDAEDGADGDAGFGGGGHAGIGGGGGGRGGVGCDCGIR